MSETTEPRITINGIIMSEGCSMAVRVACGSFLGDMQRWGTLGTDEMGEALRKGYQVRLQEVMNAMERP